MLFLFAQNQIRLFRIIHYYNQFFRQKLKSKDFFSNKIGTYLIFIIYNVIQLIYT